MLAIDTNLVVRYLTGDHPQQSPRARQLIDGQPTFVAVTVLDLAERGMDFADALHLSRSGQCEGLATFDRRLIKAAKIAGRTFVREV